MQGTGSMQLITEYRVLSTENPVLTNSGISPRAAAKPTHGDFLLTFYFFTDAEDTGKLK